MGKLGELHTIVTRRCVNGDSPGRQLINSFDP
jgi:hypothetical protein